MGICVQPLFGHVAFWVLLIAFRQGRFPTVTLLALVLIAAFLSALWRKHPVRERALALMAEVLGIFYFAVLFLYPAIPVRYDFGDRIGMQWILLLLFVIWAGDSLALVAGRTFGKHLLAPDRAPRRPMREPSRDCSGGVAAAVAARYLFLPDLPVLHCIVPLAFLLGIFGQFGDFAESLLKRAAEVKDSSHLIPGHGGALDRMDSLLFALPLLYFYLLQLY